MIEHVEITPKEPRMIIEPMPRTDLTLPPFAGTHPLNLQEMVAGFKSLLADKEYIDLRERYGRGQLSFYGTIVNRERQALGFSVTD
jgi:hypothetical protein